MTERFHLTLYITGSTPAAQRALANLKELCIQHMGGRQYELEVVNILEHPEQAEKHKILATPMVIKHLPLPIRKIIGDLSDQERVLAGLDLVTT